MKKVSFAAAVLAAFGMMTFFGGGFASAHPGVEGTVLECHEDDGDSDTARTLECHDDEDTDE